MTQSPQRANKVWNRLLSRFILDTRVVLNEVEKFLAMASDMALEINKAVGEGEEYRTGSGRVHAPAGLSACNMFPPPGPSSNFFFAPPPSAISPIPLLSRRGTTWV